MRMNWLCVCVAVKVLSFPDQTVWIRKRSRILASAHLRAVQISNILISQWKNIGLQIMGNVHTSISFMNQINIKANNIIFHRLPPEMLASATFSSIFWINKFIVSMNAHHICDTPYEPFHLSMYSLDFNTIHLTTSSNQIKFKLSWSLIESRVVSDKRTFLFMCLQLQWNWLFEFVISMEMSSKSVFRKMWTV